MARDHLAIVSKLKTVPDFWHLLSEQDQVDYINLRETLNASACQRNRGHRIEAFDAVLDAIRHYVERGDDNDWRRALVCGFCWTDAVVAINTRQLRLLISKCKSSINGSLQRLGYFTNPAHSESWRLLFQKIPFLMDHYNELRQWSLRCKMPAGSQQVPIIVTTPRMRGMPMLAHTATGPGDLPRPGAYVLTPVKAPAPGPRRDAMTETSFVPDVARPLKFRNMSAGRPDMQRPWTRNGGDEVMRRTHV
jgi:hypothetical protein